MKVLRKFQEMQRPWFEKGGRLEKLYPLFEAQDTFLFTPGKVTHGASHVRDSIDLKRIMSVVIVALVPCILMAMYNTGYQANLAMKDGTALEGWRGAVIHLLHLGYNPHNLLACFLHGALYFIRVMLVSYIAGGLCEVLCAVVRKHDVNE